MMKPILRIFRMRMSEIDAHMTFRSAAAKAT
jgi:hypothetical protein